MKTKIHQILKKQVIDKVSPFICDNLKDQGQQKQKFDRKSCLFNEYILDIITGSRTHNYSVKIIHGKS